MDKTSESKPEKKVFRSGLGIPFLVLLCCAGACLAIMGWINGCAENPTGAQSGKLSTPMSFEESIKLFTTSTAEYEAEERWDAARERLDMSSVTQIRAWLNVQQTILTNRTAVYATEPLKRSAIHEFWLLAEHAKAYEPWLEDCQNRGTFKDPFIVQNIGRTLELLRSQ